MGNIGDNLLDLVNRRELGKRMMGADFRTFCPWSESPTSILKVSKDGLWQGTGCFDAIVIGGGALLAGPPFKTPGLQSFFLGAYPERFADKCPVYWNAVCSDSQYAASLSPVWRSYVQNACSRIHAKTVRNQRTCEFLRECGVAGRIEVVPDPVLSLRPPSTRQPAARRKKRIGLALACPVFPASFLQRMQDAFERDLDIVNWSVVAVQTEALSRLLSFDAKDYMAVFHSLFKTFSDGEVEVAGFPADMYGDRTLAEQFGSEFPDVRVISIRDAEEACLWIESLDCIVASRFHTCVLAVVVGTPVVAVDLSFDSIAMTSKLMEFMASTGLLANYVTFEQLRAEPAALPNLVGSAESYRSVLHETHRDLYMASQSHFDWLAGDLRSVSRIRECPC